MAELLLKWKRPVILQIPLAKVNVCLLSYCYGIYVKIHIVVGVVFYLTGPVAGAYIINTTYNTCTTFIVGAPI